MLIRPAIGDTDPIRYRRPTPDGQFSGNIIDEAMRMPIGVGTPRRFTPRSAPQLLQVTTATLRLAKKASQF
jgi:hypothetical protein